MEKEEWKYIIGYEGYYKASNLGRVKSVDRISYSKRHNKLKRYKGRILSGRKSGQYYCVVMCKDGFKKSFRIHQLIAIAFLSHTPCGHNVVIDHIDGNKTNNHISNLQLITNRDNCSKDKINKTSKYTGVWWFKKQGKWNSQIRHNGLRINLGYFTCETKAFFAYQRKLNDLL